MDHEASGDENGENWHRVRILDPACQTVLKTLQTLDIDDVLDPNFRPYFCSGLAIDRDQNILLANLVDKTIEVFCSNTGQKIKTIGTSNEDDENFFLIGGIAVDLETGNIVVSDDQIDRITILSDSGEIIRWWGSRDTGLEYKEGEFGEPKGIDLDKNGNVIVADYLNSRIQIFSPEGASLMEFGDGKFHGPRTPLIDRDGRIWVISDNGINVFGDGSEAEF